MVLWNINFDPQTDEIQDASEVLLRLPDTPRIVIKQADYAPSSGQFQIVVNLFKHLLGTKKLYVDRIYVFT